MFTILKLPSIRKIIVLAILIRLLITPFYFHPDIKTYNFQASFLKKGVWNIYDYLSDHKSNLPLKDEFVYFPLTYFLLGGYQVVAAPFLGPGFETWLSNANSNSSNNGIFRYLFILKLPYLLLDVLIGLLLVSFFSEVETKKKILIAWLFNPFSIALIYIYSNVDIFPVFLVVLSLYYARKNNFLFSSLALGLGAGFKAFPLLLVPFLFLKAQTFKDKIIIVIFSFGTFILTILPFGKSMAFRESTLVSGLTTRIVSNGLNIGFNEILMPAIVLLSILIFWGISKAKIELWRYYLVAFLLTLISIHFHIQWLLWIIPFLVIAYVLDSGKEKKLIVMFLAISFIIPLLYTDKFMTVGLLRAISPLYELLPTPQTLLSKIYDPLVIQGVLHSILFGLGLLLSQKIISKE